MLGLGFESTMKTTQLDGLIVLSWRSEESRQNLFPGFEDTTNPVGSYISICTPQTSNLHLTSQFSTFVPFKSLFPPPSRVSREWRPETAPPAPAPPRDQAPRRPASHPSLRPPPPPLKPPGFLDPPSLRRRERARRTYRLRCSRYGTITGRRRSRGLSSL